MKQKKQEEKVVKFKRAFKMEIKRILISFFLHLIILSHHSICNSNPFEVETKPFTFIFPSCTIL